MIDGMSILVTVVGKWEGVEFKTVQVSRVRVNVYARPDFGRKRNRGRVDINRWVGE
jgi:hypothetical protein